MSQEISSLLSSDLSKGSTTHKMTSNSEIDESVGLYVPAIQLKNASKFYKSGNTKMPVLIDLDMNVLKGQIYGLLGPSGCGKTTLLKCIVGKLRLDSGSVEVFGNIPGNRFYGIPGNHVGYMPQELALFGEFSITETLRYFSRIYGLSKELFEERLEFLITFLNLPSKTRMLQNMSGGQQRRASLAVALIHQPELLILDEPTVGVDPILRNSIWKHLNELSNIPGNETTIVITTHYIEEAIQANSVGMMRFGKLLEEGSPEQLILKHQKKSLEEVFLNLCLQDGHMDINKIGKKRKNWIKPIFNGKKSKNPKCPNVDVDDISPPLKDVVGNDANGSAVTKASRKSQIEKRNENVANNKANGTIPRKCFEIGKTEFSNDCLKLSNVYACMHKTLNRLKKRLGFLVYQFVLPAIHVLLFCLAVGGNPKGISVAIVNDENNGCSNMTTMYECPITINSWGIPTPNQHLANLSCRFLNFLDTSMINIVDYDNIETAKKAVVDGYVRSVVSMRENFTQNLYERLFYSLSHEDLKNDKKENFFKKSSILINMDLTNQHIALSLQTQFHEAFQLLMTNLLTSCNMSAELLSIPLIFEEPILGDENLTFTDFMAPGIVLTIVHSMALGYSAMIIIMERNEGMLERTWVAGVTVAEVALGHFLVSVLINFLQVVITIVMMIYIFKVPAEGSIILIFLLSILQGISGTTIGLIISSICQTQQDAIQVALGIFYPNLILSGIIWPLEAMPTVLRYFSYCLPQTFACEAMRGILLKGWGITYVAIWRGFAVTIAWIVVTCLIFKKLVSRKQ